jgi:ABC-2 type transport system permease protein
MNRFPSLLQREWMQHRLGWIIMLAAPFAVTAILAVFGAVSFDFSNHGNGDDGTVVEKVPSALILACASVGAMVSLTLAVACLFALFQAPGLARRDTQDRSIEFWLSLPQGHAQSLSATLLAHLLLVPWAALVAGLAGGLVVSLLVVAKAWSLAAWATLPWGVMLAAAVMMTLRLALGLALALLWLSPLILLTMAASAWLKRWGVPLVACVLVIGGLVLEKLYGITFIGDALRTIGENAGRALFFADRSGAQHRLVVNPGDDLLPYLREVPSWVIGDIGSALQQLATPAFVAALAVAALGFALLVLRRQRGA